MNIDYAANIAALEAAQPVWLTREDIVVKLGAPWVPASMIAQFANSLIRNANVEVIHEPYLNTWRIELGKYAGSRNSSEALSLGAGGCSLWDLLTDCLHQRQTEVTGETADGKKFRDEGATMAARERQTELNDQFEEWAWSHPDRAGKLEQIYNTRFNSHVVPTYDGSHMTFPGLSATVTPRAYQANAAWRTVTSPHSTLFPWRVGAGKTLGAALAVQEMRRLGHINKAMIVVPNHMLDGWAREYMQAYPTAKLLMATREMTTGAERQRFAAMCATGNWDAIVITESGFGRIPLSPRTQARHLADTLGALDEAIAACEASWSVKRLERTRKRLEAKHKALLSADTKDVGVTFEQLGVDFLVIDELHRYKNLEIVSVIRGVASTGTQRAEDLMAKMSWLRRQHPGRPVALGLTATPISNAVAEMHTITRFVAPEVLDDAGVGPFDAWAATFAQTVNLFEMTPEGDGYRVVERFARFHNVPEMANMYRRFADVLDAADTADGRPDTERLLHEIKPGDHMTAYMGHLIERARLVRNRRVSKDVDNLLAITTSGRLAAVDPRLVGVNADPENKLTAVADKIADTYHATADTDYGTSTPGGFQLVFCDLGTPSRKGWNCYTELTELLTARGVKAGHIEFIHDHKTDADKGRLFNACRNGNVRILIGSTETCGIGMNVQTRLTDLHHVNPPWKPAEVEQRDGRGPRPGNLNKTVRIHTYITVGSFDAYSWTILTRKAGFLAQLAAGSTAQRTLDVLDVDDRVLSYEEIKAIASGNPLVLRKAELDAEHHRLTRLRGQHRAAASRMRWDVQALRSAVDRLKADQTALTAVVKAIDPKAGFVVAGDLCSNETAGEAIKGTVEHGTRRNFEVRGLRVAQDARSVEFSTMTSRWQSVRRNLNGHAGRSATAAYKQILAFVDGFPGELDKIAPEIERRVGEADAIEARANIDWPHHARLAELTIELAEVNQALLESAEAA